MRRKTRKNSKIIFGILIIIALGVAAVVAYEYFLKPKPEEKPADEPAPTQVVTSAQEPVNDQGKGEVVETVNGKEPVVQYDGDNPNDNGGLTGVVTYAGATDSSIIIRVNIDQYVDGGTCQLSLMQDGDIAFTTSANLIADVSTSTCEGFNLSRSVVGSGNFAISIKLSSGDKTGVINGELNL